MRDSLRAQEPSIHDRLEEAAVVMRLAGDGTGEEEEEDEGVEMG